MNIPNTIKIFDSSYNKSPNTETFVIHKKNVNTCNREI